MSLITKVGLDNTELISAIELLTESDDGATDPLTQKAATIWAGLQEILPRLYQDVLKSIISYPRSFCDATLDGL